MIKRVNCLNGAISHAMEEGFQWSGEKQSNRIGCMGRKKKTLVLWNFGEATTNSRGGEKKA